MFEDNAVFDTVRKCQESLESGKRLLFLKLLLATDGWQLNGALKPHIVCVAIIFHKCPLNTIDCSK